MKLEFSAGGIVYKKQTNRTLILLAKHSQHHGWIFPKGIIGDHIQGETKQQTALREVKEETGIDAQILQELPTTTYWYVFQGEKRKKTVYYFLMQYTSGDTTHHDNEMEEIQWTPEDKVTNTLTYPSDQKIWLEAKQLIQQL